MATKQERLDEFLRRLQTADPCKTLAEARALLAETLDAVEDEMTEIPNNPANWMTDGRMYPPQDDQRRTEQRDPLVVRFRSKGHNNWIGENGSISIIQGSTTCLVKPGRDGRTIQDLMDTARPDPSSTP